MFPTMSAGPHSIRRVVVAVTVSLLLTGAVGLAVAAPSATKITPAGVGKVKLGKGFTELRQLGLIGQLRPGCELAMNTRSAKLKSPLEGSVNFTTDPGPRKVTDIQITGGATARGVGIGSSKSEIKDAYPKAKFDKSTKDVFGIVLVRISKQAGGKLQMAVSVDSKKVTLIGVPGLAFCE